MCNTNFHINYDFFPSKSLNSPNLYINWTCSIVSKVFIYASNKWLCGTLIINVGKNLTCTCYCKQIKSSFCKNQIRIQNMCWKFEYVQLHICAKTVEIKLLRLEQLIIYRSLLSCQHQCIKFKSHMKTLSLEYSLI